MINDNSILFQKKIALGEVAIFRKIMDEDKITCIPPLCLLSNSFSNKVFDNAFAQLCKDTSYPPLMILSGVWFEADRHAADTLVYDEGGVHHFTATYTDLDESTPITTSSNLQVQRTPICKALGVPKMSNFTKWSKTYDCLALAWWMVNIPE
jgi:hypothetical protein